MSARVTLSWSPWHILVTKPGCQGRSPAGLTSTMCSHTSHLRIPTGRVKGQHKPWAEISEFFPSGWRFYFLQKWPPRWSLTQSGISAMPPMNPSTSSTAGHRILPVGCVFPVSVVSQEPHGQRANPNVPCPSPSQTLLPAQLFAGSLEDQVYLPADQPTADESLHISPQVKCAVKSLVFWVEEDMKDLALITPLCSREHQGC